MLWIETKTPQDAKQLVDRMWGLEIVESPETTVFKVRGEGLFHDGEFWADAIKKLKEHPDARLSMAMQSLPLPGAFREAAIALRAIIRRNRKQSGDPEQALRQLYSLAAVWSFYIPYAPRLQQPGYNVLERIPFSEFESMSLTWESLGYRELTLLKKTERKWMVDAWGEPSAHTTAHQKYKTVWERYESILCDEKTRAWRLT